MSDSLYNVLKGAWMRPVKVTRPIIPVSSDCNDFKVAFFGVKEKTIWRTPITIRYSTWMRGYNDLYRKFVRIIELSRDVSNNRRSCQYIMAVSRTQAFTELICHGPGLQLTGYVQLIIEKVIKCFPSPWQGSKESTHTRTQRGRTDFLLYVV